MRTIFPDKLEAGRTTGGAYGTPRGAPAGLFDVAGPCGEQLRIVTSAASVGDSGWDHVSVSTRRRCPNWLEMCFAKDLFWEDEECVLQFHPPRSQWIDNHPYCLHMFKPPYEVVLPPSIMVGVQGLSYEQAASIGRSKK